MRGSVEGSLADAVEYPRDSSRRAQPARQVLGPQFERSDRMQIDQGLTLRADDESWPDWPEGVRPTERYSVYWSQVGFVISRRKTSRSLESPPSLLMTVTRSQPSALWSLRY
jgi:hypothetical protein